MAFAIKVGLSKVHGQPEFV